MTESNIILIGMSGAGKSTAGVLIAKALGKSFTDTDLLLQQHSGMLLQEYINKNGNDAFLALEEELLSSVYCEDTVIATGGSAVYSDRAMRHLCKLGTVVYLHVSLDEIKRRIGNSYSRGIVYRNSETLDGVYAERLPLYEKYADITVDCDGKSTDEVINEITSKSQKK